MGDSSSDLKEKVTRVIRHSVIATFDELFHADVTAEHRKNQPYETGELTCRVDLVQDDAVATMRFSFDKKLLRALIIQWYPSESLTDDSYCADAACEIANIICSRVKSFLNTQGFHMSMQIPYAEHPDAVALPSPDTLHLGFHLSEEDFFVDFGMQGIGAGFHSPTPHG